MDLAPFLAKDKTVEIARSEPSPDSPSISGCRFTLRKAYDDPQLPESFDKKINPRFRPGQRVSIQIYWDGAWRNPPFGATTYIKFAFPRDTGTYEEIEIEAQGKLAQVLEIDKAFDPERKYDSQGNQVPQTRDVLGVTRSLKDIVNSYLHVKGVGPVLGGSGFLTQTTNTYKEYLADSSDSEINFAQQLTWYNPDRASELNFLYENQAGETAIASIPLDLNIVTPAKRLLDCTWGLYTTDLLIYEPERNVEQLAEFIEVQGVASVAQARQAITTDNGQPAQMSGLSLNVAINPITNTETTTTIDWAQLTITVDAKTYSTPGAIAPGSSGGGIGNQLVQRDVTTKYFDSKKRCNRETLFRYVPDAIKLGTTGTSEGTVGTPAYQKETLYNLSTTDKVLSTIVHETAASAIANGSESNPATLTPLNTGVRKNTDLGGGAYSGSAYAVANIGFSQNSVPYFPASYAGNDERAQPQQCEYFPDQYYVVSTPLRRRVEITWDTALTGRTTIIDVGNAILTGQNFDLLANSLARFHTAKHEQYNCSFPLSTALFTDWQTPGKIISVLEPRKNVRSHYFTGADSIEISNDSIVCRTTLFWIGSTDEATGAQIPGPTTIAQTQYIIDDTGAILTTETGDRLTWS